METALSGAGWQANGSQSVEAREQIDRNFAGVGSYALQVVVHSRDRVATAPGFRETVARSQWVLRRDPAVRRVAPPRPGVSISPDGHTAVIRAGAGADPNAMVDAADRLKTRLADVARPGVAVSLTGAPGMWSDFNQANREAMLKSEFISWPLTMAILVLAFGSLVAAGLPLMLTITGLIASAGLLFLGTLVSPISIWAMNFALMFALALGIDYALFIVMRFRGAHFGQELSPVDAVATTMDTAGKAVLVSAMTVVVSLSAVMLVPSPAFRSTSLGIIVAVLFVLAATLTLLPAVLAKLGPRVDRLSLPGAQRRASLCALRPLGRAALAAAVSARVASLWWRWWFWPYRCSRCAPRCPRSRWCRRTTSPGKAMSRSRRASGRGRRALQIVALAAGRQRVVRAVQADPHRPIAAARAGRRWPGADRGGPDQRSIQPAAGRDHRSPPLAASSDTLIGGPAAENHDLEAALAAKTPVVIGVVLTLGFLVLLVAFQAPVAAAIGVVTNLLATGAAFGIAKWIFQDGHLAGLLGFEPQGFLDAWAGVLLRDDLRDLDGLHGLPALLRQTALGRRGRRSQGDGWRPADPGA